MDKFIITPKEDDSATMTIRISQTLQDKFNELAAKTNRSRNELINMVLTCTSGDKYTGRLRMRLIRVPRTMRLCHPDIKDMITKNQSRRIPKPAILADHIIRVRRPLFSDWNYSVASDHQHPDHSFLYK